MSYNLLIYPEGDIPDRIDTLANIVSYYQPDLFMVQELKSEQGLLQIKDLFNSFPNSHYESGTYVPQVSNPSNSWRLQQNLIYNANVFRMDHEEVIETPYRDINYFKLYILDSELNEGADTTFVHVYVTHLKSSQGADNESLRLAMAEVMVEEVNDLPAGSLVIAGGDFNLYSSTEPAYQYLLSENVVNPLKDPIDMPGEWTSSSFPNKEILTQSTRLNSLSDGAGGGLDDRFDFVLLSENLMSGNSAISYIDGSYKALGNNGTCYNQGLLNCMNGNEVPPGIIWSLYYMSDHLPVVFELSTSIVLGKQDILSDERIQIYPNPSSQYFFVDGLINGEYQVIIRDVTGRIIQTQDLEPGEGFSLSETNKGMYICRIMQGSTVISNQRLFLN